jgi:hypothetical protein
VPPDSTISSCSTKAPPSTASANSVFSSDPSSACTDSEPAVGPYTTVTLSLLPDTSSARISWPGTAPESGKRISIRTAPCPVLV